jgi:glycine betaine/proline transport system ATP-binding protein
MKTANVDIDDVLIDCQSLWKVFGDKSAAAMKSIKERGLGKKEVLQEFNCVVGVSEASLQVRRGEIFCIMGLSGSGKSTLIRLLNKLIAPSSGKVLVKGRDLAALSPADRTVLENAAFGLEVQGITKPERNKTAAAALEKVGLADWVSRYPNELSGGMQQRVGLARALASDPEIILMDEPFSALDPLIRRQLQDEFRQLTKSLGKSAVFITHDLDEAIRIGDRIAIMKDGVIIQTGTAEEIILNPADAYVAEFVAGISRLHLIKAHSVMRSVAEFQQSAPNSDIASLTRTRPDADIDELITLTMQSERDAIAVVDKDQVVGVVTPRSLLMGVKGTSAHDLTAA